MMTDEEMNSGGTTACGSSVVVVKQSSASRHKPCHPTDVQDESLPDLHHKRSRAPAVPSVAEVLKDSAETNDIKEKIEVERESSSEMLKNIIAKKISSASKRRTSSPEAIAMAVIEAVDMKKTDTVASPSQPIPTPITVGPVSKIKDNTEAEKLEAENKEAVKTDVEKTQLDKKSDTDSITEEITELRTAEAKAKVSEWPDFEEAGGLPRSESRASRMSRAMRQLFCCGVRYEAASEDNLSTPRAGINDGI